MKKTTGLLLSTLVLSGVVLSGCGLPAAQKKEEPKEQGLLGDRGLVIFQKGGNQTSGIGGGGLFSSVSDALWQSTLETLAFTTITEQNKQLGAVETTWTRFGNYRSAVRVELAKGLVQSSSVNVFVRRQKLSGGSWVEGPRDLQKEQALKEVILERYREIQGTQTR